VRNVFWGKPGAPDVSIFVLVEILVETASCENSVLRKSHFSLTKSAGLQRCNAV
jgi:hypothetical protein